MRSTTLLLAATLLTATYAAILPWTEFKRQYKRQYVSAEEENLRRTVYETNMRRAQEMGARNPLARFGTNAFSDVTEEEFKRRHSAEGFYARRKAPAQSPSTLLFNSKEVTAAAGQTVDWRTKGAVTGVKDQGQCGSCWAFSSTGSIEGQYFLAGNKLTSVSEQELVSCDTIDQGCNGGLMDNAWSWLISAQKGQIVTEASYPYVSGDGNAPPCDLNGKTVGATINGHKDLAHDETQMAAFVYASGPLSVGVDATSWQTYSGGILTDCISSQVDHGVLVVGYDDTNNPPYWIIKNSWGLGWGESGYIRVQKGTNQCLITQFPCTSTVAKGPGPGPSPPGPTPPTPPGPTPPGPAHSLVQKQCTSSTCTRGCKNYTFPLGKCLKLSDGGSAIAQCNADGVLLTEYILADDCTGPSIPDQMPVNKCLQDDDGSYFENFCLTSSNQKTMSARTPVLRHGIRDKARVRA